MLILQICNKFSSEAKKQYRAIFMQKQIDLRIKYKDFKCLSWQQVAFIKLQMILYLKPKLGAQKFAKKIALRLKKHKFFAKQNKS